jgi:DNA-binding transcriptional LysR family regulator
MLFMVPKLNFRQIDAFRSVMVSGSVVGAAKLLNVTQPGVSRTIATLEMRLGYELFVRRGRRLLPTAEAEALYREVEQVYASLDRISNVALDIRHQRAGALRVATLPALAQGLVPRAIARFLSTRPEVTLFVQSLPSRLIAEQVSTRQFDVGVVEMPLSRPATVIEPLPSGRVVAVMSAAHPLANRGRISIKDLDGERMVMLAQGSFVRYQIDDAFSKVGAAPRVVLETPSSSIACALVAEGAGVALVARLTAEPFLGSGLAICALDEDVSMRYALVYPQLTARMPLAEAFAAELRHEFGQAASGS